MNTRHRPKRSPTPDRKSQIAESRSPTKPLIATTTPHPHYTARLQYNHNRDLYAPATRGPSHQRAPAEQSVATRFYSPESRWNQVAPQRSQHYPPAAYSDDEGVVCESDSSHLDSLRESGHSNAFDFTMHTWDDVTAYNSRDYSSADQTCYRSLNYTDGELNPSTIQTESGGLIRFLVSGGV